MKKNKLWFLIIAIAITLVGCGTKEKAGTDNSKASGKSQETVLYMTRHGKTILNTLDRVQGWADTPLTEEGRDVATKLGEGLKKDNIKFVSVYSSDLGRAKETAKLVLEAMGDEKQPIIESEKLREGSYGMFEGDSNTNMAAAMAKENNMTPEEFAATGMDMWGLGANAVHKIDTLKIAEDADTIVKRMNEEVLKIAQDTEKNGGGNVLIVGHGMSISMLLDSLAPDIEFSGHLPNASVSKVTFKDGKLHVESIGDVSYSE